MASLLKIYHLPYETLYQKAKPVETVDGKIRAFLDDMVFTMHEFKGVGLAANQVGILRRCIVVDTDQIHSKGEIRTHDNLAHDGKPICLVNPEIIELSNEVFQAEEGCLSCPGITVMATRHNWIRVKYIDYNNTMQEVKAHGLFGQCIQHEIDHLDGKTLPDFATSPMQKSNLLNKVKKASQYEETPKDKKIEDARIIYRDLL